MSLALLFVGCVSQDVDLLDNLLNRGWSLYVASGHMFLSWNIATLRLRYFTVLFTFHKFSTSLFLFLFIPGDGFPNGPPAWICPSGHPYHGVDAQTSSAPFTLTASQSSYLANDQITSKLTHLSVVSDDFFSIHACDLSQNHLSPCSTPNFSKAKFQKSGAYRLPTRKWNWAFFQTQVINWRCSLITERISHLTTPWY